MRRIVNHWLTSAAYIVLIVAGGQKLVQASDEDALRHRFAEEAPSGWNRFKMLMLKAKGHITYHDRIVNADDDSKSSKPRQRRVSFAIAGDGRRLAIADQNDRETIFVGCRNLKYAFKLMGSTLHENVFKILDVRAGAPMSDAETQDPVDAQFFVLVRPVLYAPFALLQFEADKLVADSSFECKSIHRIGEGEDSTVEVAFSCRDPYDDTNEWLSDIHMELVPQNGWAIEKYLAVNKKKHAAISVNIEYGDTIGDSGLRMPVKVVARNAPVDFEPARAKEYEEQVFQLDDIEFVDVDDKEFTLSAFNRPEPGKSVALGGNKWVLVGINVGIILLIVGFYLFRRARVAA